MWGIQWWLVVSPHKGTVMHFHVMMSSWYISNTPFTSSILWVDINILWTGHTYIRQWTRSSLIQVMAWHQIGAKPSPEPMLTYRQWNRNQNSIIFIHKIAFQNVVCQMVAILFSPQCVNDIWAYINLLTIWPLVVFVNGEIACYLYIVLICVKVYVSEPRYRETWHDV